MDAPANLYERLGVAPQVELAELRAAYHQRARELHPDVVDDAGPQAQLRMALVNEAWRVLSDPQRRDAYDRALAALALASSASSSPRAPTVQTRPPRPPRPPGPPRGAGPGTMTAQSPTGWRVRTPFARREAWLDSIRLQIRRLGRQAGRSAAQSLLLRHHGTSREAYEAEIDPIIAHLLADTEARVRAARAAGAAPLDLANGAALLGLWSLTALLVAERPPTESTYRRADMVDRMFDTMAHELPRGLVRALGDNPRAARRLGQAR